MCVWYFHKAIIGKRKTVVSHVAQVWVEFDKFYTSPSVSRSQTSYILVLPLRCRKVLLCNYCIKTPVTRGSLAFHAPSKQVFSLFSNKASTTIALTFQLVPSKSRE